MILAPRLLSARAPSAGLLLAALTFVLGLAIGSTIGPTNASRSVEAPVVAAPAPARLDPPAVRLDAPPPLRMVYPAEVVRVVDGDTFEARVHLWPGLDTTTRVRLRGIDAPEMKARCVAEQNSAERARNALKAILDQGEIGITRVTLDKYGGRVLAEASTRGTANVSAALLAAGVVRPYDGGRRETWCP